MEKLRKDQHLFLLEELKHLKVQIKEDILKFVTCCKQISFSKGKKEKLSNLQQKAMKINNRIKNLIKIQESEKVKKELEKFSKDELQEQCFEFGIEIREIKTRLDTLLERVADFTKGFMCGAPQDSITFNVEIVSGSLSDKYVEKNNFAVSQAEHVTQQPS